MFKQLKTKFFNNLKNDCKSDFYDSLNSKIGISSFDILIKGLLTSIGNDSFSNYVFNSMRNAYTQYLNLLRNYVTKREISFVLGKDVNNFFLKSADNKITIFNYNFELFKDDFNDDKVSEEINGKEVELIEYSYNVDDVISYYSRRFPEIFNLFDVFSDLCLSRGDINVFIKFSDSFLNSYFKDVFMNKNLSDTTQKLSNLPNDFNEDVGSEDDIDSLLNELSNLSFIYNMNMEKAFDSFRRRLKKNGKKIDEHKKDFVIKLYKQIYEEYSLEYRVLVSTVEEKINDFVNSSVIKKLKNAISIADMYGYSIVAVPKTKGNLTILVLKPTECLLYLPKGLEFSSENIIYVLKGQEENIVLNNNYECFLFSLDSAVFMPVPSVIKISYYLYLLDLLETLMVFNDISKIRQLNILEIPLNVSDNESGEESDAVDDLALAKLIIDSIESKLSLSSNVKDSLSSFDNADYAAGIIQNAGVNIAYVPRFAKDGIRHIKIDSAIEKYDTVYNLILEKIYSTLKFPIQCRVSDLLTSLKTLPREVVQFGHAIMLSRANQVLSEVNDLMKVIVTMFLNNIEIEKDGKKFVIEVSNIYLELNNIIEELFFDKEVSENLRSLKINNITSLLGLGLPLNPKQVVKYIFPEFSYQDVFLNFEDVLNVRSSEEGNKTTENYRINYIDILKHSSSKVLDNGYAMFNIKIR